MGTNYDSEYNDSQALAKMVQTLVHPYLGKNHVLFVDNWYSSSILFEWVHDRDTGACATVRCNVIKKDCHVCQRRWTMEIV